MRASRGLLLLAGVLFAGARPAGAQDSQFGIRGLGTPGRFESVRARSTGGAFAAFDAVSALADVSLVDVRVLTATAMGAATYRSLTSPNGDAELRASRFPLFTLAGRLTGRVIAGGGFTTYLDRSYDVVTLDSAVLRGETVRFADQFASDGGISDLRVAAAFRVRPSLALGLGLHAITGSSRVTATRAFSDLSDYSSVRDTQLVRQSGFGISGSALITPASNLSIIGFARADGHFNNKVDSASSGQTDLPNMVGGAARLILSSVARVAGSVVWRSWGSSGPDASNTITWSAGVELGVPGDGIRFGGRGGKLPFGPGGDGPTEWGLAAGIGRTFSGNHGVVDLGIERLVRDGGGLHETMWTVMFGLTIKQ
jgi:hypothetical protein